MTLAPGTKLGPYEILSPLGAGGMGEVWKAKDARLDRFVAIKVLPEHLATHPDALARFEQEAKMVAALNHPNITGLFDIGREGELVYAVMELLEGESLRTRLNQGPLPPRKTVELAAGMAEGLAAAHAKGVIHRDLKPDNLWITKEGRLKILDFGLSKQVAKLGSASNSLLPTEALAGGGSHRTEEGLILGTVGYMSPEQVRGEALDARSDIFAFGVVLFEMLSGKRAFARNTTSDTLAAILRDDPPELEASGRSIPSGLQRILHHCLEKDPAHRFQETHDLAFALSALSGSGESGSGTLPIPAASTRDAWRAAPWLAGGALGLLAGAALVGFWPRTALMQAPASIRAITYSGHDASPAVSPDGQTLAFSSDRDGTSRIWLKRLKGGEERALTAGTDIAPRFSPDGTAILFTRIEGPRHTLCRIALMGDEPRVMAANASLGDWSPDGTRIAFIRTASEKGEADFSLMTLPAGGGTETLIHRFGQNFVASPRWSPDGRRIALSRAQSAAGGILNLYTVELSNGRVTELPPPSNFGALSTVAWIDSENIICIQSESPAGNGTAVSPARAYRQNVVTRACQPLFWAPSSSQTLDLLPDGRVVFDAMSGRQNLREYVVGSKAPPRWLTRGSISDRQPVFSPDAEWVAFSSNRTGNLDIWAVSTKTGKVRSLTDDPADDWDPAFTPDGKNLIWSSNRGGNLEIWAANADGSGARQVTHDGEDAENPTQTRDGKWIVYVSGHQKHPGLWKIHPDGTGAQILVPGAQNSLPEVSPDGAHVVFRTNNLVGVDMQVARIDDGTVIPFPASIERPLERITPFGRVRWSANGRQLLFTGQDAQGRVGVFIQDFVPGQDTRATCRPLAGFDPDWITESLGLSPDGKRLVLSDSSREFSIHIADGLPGLARKGKAR